MPLRVRRPIQPFSPATLRPDGPLRVRATSRTGTHLVRELERYARGEASGRAVLIAGLPGSGKTGLVLHALLDARKNLAGTGFRPLLVPIEGPNLLMPDGGDAPTEKDTSAEHQTLADVELVLKRATIALVFAVEDEVYRCLLQRATSAHLPSGSSPQDIVELATRLKVELARSPSLAGLRDIWRRAGLLDGGGLLGAPGAVGHGLQEVLALWSASQAFQLASGKVDLTHGESVSAGKTEARTWEVMTTGRQFLNPLLGLLSGGLLGASLLEQSGPLAAALGTLTALATTTTLNFTAKRLLEANQSQSLTFTPDTGPFALARLLPRLVAQLREVGLAPVFLVDELDKVKHLHRRLDALVSHLKYFVAEDAFFCFLTDRDYFEYLRMHRGRPDAPATSSALTDQLLVTWRPEELRAFAAASIEVDDKVTDGERDAREVLAAALVARSGLRLVRLIRLLSALEGGEDRLDKPDAPVVGQELLYTLSVEKALDQPAIKERIERDPWFFALALDTLTWIHELWGRGLAPALTPERLRRRLVKGMDVAALEMDTHGHSPGLSAEHLRTFFEAVCAQARDLVEPQRVRAWAATRLDLPAALVAALPAQGLLVADLAETVCNEKECYTFVMDAYGFSALPRASGAG